MRDRVSVTVGRPSIRLSHRSTAANAAGGFAAERPAGRRYRSTACALQRRRCSAAKAGSVTLRADGGGSTQTCIEDYFCCQYSLVTGTCCSYFVRRFRPISQQPFIAHVCAIRRQKALGGCNITVQFVTRSNRVFSRKSHMINTRASSHRESSLQDAAACCILTSRLAWIAQRDMSLDFLQGQSSQYKEKAPRAKQQSSYFLARFIIH